MKKLLFFTGHYVGLILISYISRGGPVTMWLLVHM